MGFLPSFLSGALHKEVEEITKGYDVAFFPWPYFINCPLSIGCPMVATFHDFNYRYYFTGQSFNPTALEVLNREMPLWLERSYPVVSTHFMKSEMCKFFPQFGEKARVVHLAPLSSLSNLSDAAAQDIVGRMGITQPYILYPTNISPHKNIGAILAAHYLLKQMGHRVVLVIAGFGTEMINGRSVRVGIERDSQNRDVMGLGYVSNEQMDALIQRAQVVVSTSLYEAGSGPGLDAWAKGTPVAMSDIPPFVEHLEVQNVRAALYNPLSPVEIAEKLHGILMNPQKARDDAEHSKAAIASFTWELAAKKYLDVFDEAVSRGSSV
jgi:glycosyltransferase involved in cell wall biosynthesis